MLVVDFLVRPDLETYLIVSLVIFLGAVGAAPELIEEATLATTLNYRSRRLFSVRKLRSASQLW